MLPSPELISSLSQFLGMLPLLLLVGQVVFYVFIVLFFGSIAVRGWMGYLPFSKKLLLRIGAGAVCLIGSVSLAPIIPFLNTGIFKLFQVDIAFWCLIVSIVLGVSFYLISRKMPRAGKRIKILEKRLRKVESVLASHKIFSKPVNEKSAKNRVKNVMGGWKVGGAKLKKDTWVVVAEKGGKRQNVLVDAYSGDVIKKGLDIVKIAGIVIIALVLIVSIINFQGFPSMEEDISSTMGISLTDLSNTLGNYSQMMGQSTGGGEAPAEVGSPLWPG